MKLQARRTNVKRHTTGYKVGGRWRSRAETVKLARQGKINGVKVCRGEHGQYIQAMPGCMRMYDLPEVVES